ncbi:MAG: L-serine ammonia-lyase [Pseudomonadota bacterium]
MRTSVLDLFRIGVGPSSSHTVGPMRATHAFVSSLETYGQLLETTRVEIELFGSLALTGRGHGTDRAVLLGLSGERPDTVDPDHVEPIISSITTNHRLNLLGRHSVAFNIATDLLWRRDLTLPGHPNALACRAFNADGQLLQSRTYYSIGGGFVLLEGEVAKAEVEHSVPHPFTSAKELLERATAAKLPIWKLILENESARHGEAEVRAYLLGIWSAMRACMERGLVTTGILPGGLNVKRRAPRLHQRLQQQHSTDPMVGMDWINVYAMAVNEENAAGGRVVTAPTNGAAGVIPAVLRYYEHFVPGADQEGVLRFLLAAGAIGILYKENASISGAEVGCQGEVGVACSMAAAGLVAALNGSNVEIEHAAEIGMEHHLGMTCDPIGGLVQIPCIERNAIGAVKAINACRMAMQEGEDHKVSLDQVIKTMFETGRDMQSRYKETSLGGLAVNVVEC